MSAAQDAKAQEGQGGRRVRVPFRMLNGPRRIALRGTPLAPRHRLRRGGAASRLARITRDDLARRYGYFLDHLSRMGPLDERSAPAEQVTPENVERFIAELRTRVGSVTLAQTIYKLRRMSELLSLEQGFDWLRDIEKDLAFDAVPKSRTSQLVDGPRLLEAGLAMVKEGELGTSLSPLKRARLVRNGLMIALLALCPIRLKNFASLELGSSVRRGQGYMVDCAGQDRNQIKTPRRKAAS